MSVSTLYLFPFSSYMQKTNQTRFWFALDCSSVIPRQVYGKRVSTGRYDIVSFMNLVLVAQLQTIQCWTLSNSRFVEYLISLPCIQSHTTLSSSLTSLETEQCKYLEPGWNLINSETNHLSSDKHKVVNKTSLLFQSVFSCKTFKSQSESQLPKKITFLSKDDLKWRGF